MLEKDLLNPIDMRINITLNEGLNDFATSWPHSSKTFFDLYDFGGKTAIPLNYNEDALPYTTSGKPAFKKVLLVPLRYEHQDVLRVPDPQI